MPLHGIRLPLFDRHAIKRLRINEPGTNISANTPEVGDAAPGFYKQRPFILRCSLFFSIIFITAINATIVHYKITYLNIDDGK